MAKKRKAMEKALAELRRTVDAQASEQQRSVRRLERRLGELAREHKALRKRLKRLDRLARRSEAPARMPVLPPGPVAGPDPDAGKGPRRRRGRPPWAEGLGPVVSLEVPLETHDPGAPLWATVAARLPEEITVVGDDGRVARYRYSAAGSTPQAPRYRRLGEPAAPSSWGP